MDLIVTLLVITCFSLFLTRKCGLDVTVTPFVTLSGIMFFLTAAGICDLLVPGVIVIYAAAAACLCCTVWADRRQWKKLLEVFQPGYVFFIAATLFFWFVLKSRNAGFRVWDEFSFWGVAAKAIYERRAA